MGVLEYVSLLAGVIAVYIYRADFEKYSIFTTGVFRRVSRRVVETGEVCDDLYCETIVAPGERRRWYKEIVIAGMPVIRFGGGTHYYCEDHVAFDIRNDLDEPYKPTVERLGISLAEGIVGFAKWELDTTKTDDNPLKNAQTNVVSGMGAAVQLIPVVILVLITALMISFVRRVGDV